MYLSQFSTVISETSITGPHDSLLLDQAGPIDIYYLPFEHINLHARVMLVGITPGPTQMANAMAVARRHILSGKSEEDILRETIKAGAFSGSIMRKNLASQLNHWGIHEHLGIPDSDDLFGPHADLVHTTSLLRYPVFVDGKPYNGKPGMLRTPVLKKMLMTHFVDELKAVPNALVLPLGSLAAEILNHLTAEGVVDASRVFGGLLHPSPNCSYRISWLTGKRDAAVPHATCPAAYDAGRSAFRSTLLRGKLL